MTRLKKGDQAPDFKATNEKGALIQLSDFRGKKLILFFYPKDNTPTCTEEACNLRDNYKALTAEGYELLGVSPDSEKKHQNFIKKFSFPFPLLSDKDLKVIKAYDVWGPKQMFGRTYEGVYRTTFVIDEKGRIEQVIKEVKAKEHAEQIMAGGE